MFDLATKPGSWRICGMMSAFTIEVGTVQYGFRLTEVMLACSTGDGLSGRPTTALCRRWTAPFSIASTLAPGMFTTT